MNGAANTQVVLVEDDADLADAVSLALRIEGFDIQWFGAAADALQHLDDSFDGVVVCDVRLPGMDGIEFFDALAECDPDIPVIFTTGHGDVPMAVAMLKKGAFDFFTKPYSTQEVSRSIERAMEKRRLVLENRRLRAALSRRDAVGVTGTSAAASVLRKSIETIAEADIDAIIAGESGTGKSYCARLIHDLGPRASRPFITLDAGLTAHKDAELILFGRDPAVGLSRTGLIERANGGTLFVDRPGKMKKSIRSRLISALETRTVLPLGAERARRLDFRVIIASDNGTSPGLKGGLGAIMVPLPPLRERREDIGDIFRAFVREEEATIGRQAGPIGEREWRHIQTHDWPGNLHELRTFARSFTLDLNPLTAIQAAPPAKRPLPQIVADFEKSVLEEALKKAAGKVSDAAQNLQVSRKTLYDKLTRYSLNPRDYR